MDQPIVVGSVNGPCIFLEPFCVLGAVWLPTASGWNLLLKWCKGMPRCATAWQARSAKELIPSGTGQSSIDVLRFSVLCALHYIPDAHCKAGLIGHLYWLPSFSSIASLLPMGFSYTYQVTVIPSILIFGYAAGRPTINMYTRNTRLSWNKQVNWLPWFPQSPNDILRCKYFQIHYSLSSVGVLLENKFYVPYFSHLNKVLVTEEGRSLWNKYSLVKLFILVDLKCLFIAVSID